MVFKTVKNILYGIMSSDKRYDPVTPHAPVQTTSPGGNIDSGKFPTIVVVPDVHGDLEGAIASVWNAYAVLERERSEGGAVVELAAFTDLFKQHLDSPKIPVQPISSLRDVGLVQLGDMVDRGPDSEKCVRFFLSIPALLGWPVWALLGNHEIASMHLPAGPAKGENSYVHPLDWKRYDPVNSRGRDRAYGVFADKASAGKCSKWSRRMLGKVTGATTDCSMYDLLTENMYGVVRWAPTHTSSAGSDAATLFVHAGVVLDWFHRVLRAKPKLIDVKKVNNLLKQIVKSLHKSSSANLAFDDSSDFFDRSMESQATKDLCSRVLPKLLSAFDVSRIIVGHTPQDNERVNTRCDGQLVLADAAMSRWIRQPAESLHPVSVILRSQRDGQELKSIEALYDYPQSEVLFTREFFQATLPKTLASDSIIAGPIMHTRWNNTQPHVLRAYVAGKTVGVGVHIEDSADKLDHEAIALLGRDDVSIFPAPLGGGSIVFVKFKCQELVSMEFAHVLSGPVKELRRFATGAFAMIAGVIQEIHNSGYIMGVPEGAQVLDALCIGDERHLFLADFTGVTRAPADARKEEFARFVNERDSIWREIESAL